jgi:hypothetical protein
VSAFFHDLSQSRNGETTKTALARTSGVPDGAKWVHHSFSPIRWLGAPVHLITSSSLSGCVFPLRREDGPKVHRLEKEEEGENIFSVFDRFALSPVGASLLFSSASQKKDPRAGTENGRRKGVMKS